jgi:hypothetical protein
MSHTTNPAFTPAILGQTEKALNAILGRHLAGTGVSEPQWVILSVAIAGDEAVDRGEFAGKVAGVLKVSEADADAQIGELAAARMLDVSDGEVKPSEAGQELHSRIRVAVTEITQRMWGDLPAEDLAVTARVLGTILARADTELAGA